MRFLQRFELSRIAIGPMVQETRCEVVYNKNNRELTLIYQCGKPTAPKMEIIPIPLTESGFAGGVGCYPDASEGCSSFLALSILPASNEKLAKFRTYEPESTKRSKKYVVLEFKEWKALWVLYTELSLNCLVGGRFSIEKSPDAVLEYFEALTKHEAKKNQKAKRKAAKKEPRNPYKKDKDDKLLLVYPFAGDKDEIEAAAEGLKEASGAPLGDDGEVSHDAQAVASDQTDATKMAEGTSNDNSSSDTNIGQGKVRRRKHFVTLRVEDYRRLDPGEWLNDSLVDFWMQW
jgi:hypothetical protein